jgi:hypothetical protein
VCDARKVRREIERIENNLEMEMRGPASVLGRRSDRRERFAATEFLADSKSS